MKKALPDQKLPPQNIEVEESILTSIMLFPGECDIVFDLLQPTDFYRTAHQKIFEAAKSLNEERKHPDLPMMVTRLRENGCLEEAGGAAYLASLIDESPVAVNLESYALVVKGAAKLRQLIGISCKITERCFNSHESFDQVIDDAHQAITSLGNDSIVDSCEPIGILVSNEIDRLEALADAKTTCTGIPSGFRDIDLMTSGFQDSDLILLAARPSMGKTALAVNIVSNVAAAGYPTLVFSLEMSKQQLTRRILASDARVMTNKFLNPSMANRDDWQRITTSACKITDLPVWIDDRAGLKYHQVRQQARKYHHTEGVKLIVIDYLQLMHGDKQDGREREISSISAALKGLAKELNIPVLVLCQLNRDLEKRPNKRPQLSDLRESGSLEQDADVVAFIYRDEVYNSDETNSNRGIAEIIFSKQRNGPVGTVKLAYLNCYTRFESLAEVS